MKHIPYIRQADTFKHSGPRIRQIQVSNNPLLSELDLSEYTEVEGNITVINNGLNLSLNISNIGTVETIRLSSVETLDVWSMSQAYNLVSTNSSLPLLAMPSFASNQYDFIVSENLDLTRIATKDMDDSGAVLIHVNGGLVQVYYNLK
jgi:hypothetical protein